MSNRKKDLEQQAAHHVSMGKVFKVLGEGHSKLAEMGDDATDVHKSIADACNKAVQEHAEQATYCMGCMKTEDDRLAKTLMSDGFTSVIPSDASDRAFGINAPQPRLVVRPGQPDPTADAVAKAAVPPQFRHLIGISEA